MGGCARARIRPAIEGQKGDAGEQAGAPVGGADVALHFPGSEW